MEQLPTVLAPATSYKVASRMAISLSRSSSWDHLDDDDLVADNVAYWNAVRRLFERRVQASDRHYYGDVR